MITNITKNMVKKNEIEDKDFGMISASQENEMNGFTNTSGGKFETVEQLKAFMKERTCAVKYAGISGYRAAFIKLNDGTILFEQWVENDKKPGQPLWKRTLIIGKRLNENRWNRVFEDMRSFVKEWIGGLADKVLETEENKWSKLYPNGKVTLHWSAADENPWETEAEVVRTTDEFIEVRTDDSRIATNADGVVRVYWEACHCPEEGVSLPLKFKDYMGVAVYAVEEEPEAEENDEDYNGFADREKYEDAKETAEDIIGDCEVYWTDDWWDHERLKVVFADGSYDGEDCVYLDKDDFNHISVEVKAECRHLTWEVMDKIADLRTAMIRGDFDEVFGVEEELPF